MKKIKMLFIVFLTTLNFLYCADMFEEFKNRVQQQYIDPFTKDLTGIICANSLNTAESLGLFKAVPPSIGLDIRVSLVLKNISPENVILNEAFKDMEFKYIPFSVLNLSKGLPLNLDLIGRFFGSSDFVFYGIGLKYKFLSLPPLIPVVNCAVGVFYNTLDVKKILKHTSYSLNIIVSVDKIPFVRPYILAGIDNAELVVDEEVGIGEMKSKFNNGMRYEVGLKLSFIPFVYFNLGYSNIYGVDGYSLSLGAKF